MGSFGATHSEISCQHALNEEERQERIGKEKR